jgi:hypothetical protein
MKRNNSRSRYRSLSNLKDLRYEQQFLQYKIKQKEKGIERDWNTIYDSWNFISTTANTLNSIIHYIPVCISAVSQIINSFRKKSNEL